MKKLNSGYFLEVLAPKWGEGYGNELPLCIIRLRVKWEKS
jgi:hypothetical protein